jgi:hypothetical protein
VAGPDRGACTFNVSQNDPYGFWVIGVYVVMIGLIPFFLGLRRLAGDLTAGRVLMAVAAVWLAVAAFMTFRHGIRPTLLMEEGAFVFGPPIGFLFWGWRMSTGGLRAASAARKDQS